MFRPFKRTKKIWSTPETLLFAVSVASAIKTSVDEKNRHPAHLPGLEPL